MTKEQVLGGLENTGNYGLLLRITFFFFFHTCFETGLKEERILVWKNVCTKNPEGSDVFEKGSFQLGMGEGGRNRRRF